MYFIWNILFFLLDDDVVIFRKIFVRVVDWLILE